MKSEDWVLLGVGGAILYFLVKKNLDDAPSNIASSIAKSASNLFNNTAEQFFYNNPSAASLVGHPEYAYMTPAKGYTDLITNPFQLSYKNIFRVF